MGDSMSVNFGFFIHKLLRWLNRPALRGCSVDRTASVGSGSNCVHVQIGRYSYLGKNNSLCNVRLGSFCSVASYCAIGGGVHPLDMVSTSPVFYAGRNVFGTHFSEHPTELNRPVTIGNDVWIGEGVFICDGVTVGDGAVIGAHSVVTHDIPPYAVVAGAPAKVIRMRFDERTVERLLKLRWWDLPDAELKRAAGCFDDVQKLLRERNA